MEVLSKASSQSTLKSLGTSSLTLESVYGPIPATQVDNGNDDEKPSKNEEPEIESVFNVVYQEKSPDAESGEFELNDNTYTVVYNNNSR